MAFLPVWDKGEEQEATAQIPLVAAAKMGFLAEWASLRTRRGVRSMGVCSRGTCRAGLCELSRQKGCLVSSVLQDSVLLWLFKVQRKENWRQPKGGASRMQGSHTVLWSWAVLHSHGAILFCMRWFMQVSRWFWVIPKDKFCIAHTSSSTHGSIPCNRKELASFFRNELLNGRARASACGACKITYT